MKFESVASEWLASLENKSTPVRRSTIKSYSSILRMHLLPRFRNASLEELAQSNNRALRELVKDLRDRYKPASLQLFCQVFDSILAYPVDDNGTRLFRCERNNTFVDLPAVVPAEQRSPAISTEELQTVVASHRYRLLFATLAGTGCRIYKTIPEAADYLRVTPWAVA